LLNRAAATSAELAAGVGAKLVDVEAALEAIAALGLSAESEPDLLPHPGQATDSKKDAARGAKPKTRKRSA